jgi:diguanylate cyclase (GGDEF)-like protein
LIDTAGEVRHTLDVKIELAHVEVGISAAEAGQRGFLITSDLRFLEPYFQGSSAVGAHIRALRILVIDNPAQLANVDQLALAVDRRFADMAKAVEAHSAGNTELAKDFVGENSAGPVSAELQRTIRTIGQLEDDLLQERQGEAQLSQYAAFLALAGFISATLILLLILYYLAKREIRQRAESAQSLETAAKDLQENAIALTRERNEVSRLNEVSNFLQSCDSFSEISTLAGPFMQTLFPDCGGAIHVTASSRNRLDRLTWWGNHEISQYFSPQQCWALRRGQMHVHAENSVSPQCEHLSVTTTNPHTLCVPLVAHGETLGLLTLITSAAEQGCETFEVTRLAEMVARQIGLTLANIRLRESLNEQAIRDPMTNTFNRRYLDIVAEKEIAKAKRFGRDICIVMIDIDHFKRFNDTHGHQAGDTAIITVTQYLQTHIRDTDWLFRYGGEEFLLILSDTAASDATERLNELRKGISELPILHEGHVIPPVTISCGIASFSGSADTFEDVVAEADEALYRAKQTGRNQVVWSELSSTPVALIA